MPTLPPSAGTPVSGAKIVPGGDPNAGRLAIEKYGCGACHIIPGVPDATGRVGPNLTGLAGRPLIAGQFPNTPDNLVRWIENPPAMKPGTAMPYLGVTPTDARNIAAYLYTTR